LIKTLPEGMTFPYEFGFVPQTRGEDGDPLDALVLLPSATYPGCVVDCRLLGAIQCTQQDPGSKVERNDRFIAVGLTAVEFIDIHSLDDLPRPMLEQLTDFFKSYHKFEGAIFEILGSEGPKAARRRLEAGTIAPP